MKEKRYCKNCGKELTGKYQKVFCCNSCSAQYNNKRRILTKKGNKKLVNCIVCGKQYWASVHINTKKCKCEECKSHNRPHYKDIKNENSVLVLSKRTAVKLFKRAGMGCAICGWNEAACDIHHIIPKKDGGSDDNGNLIYICPNCHRLCHTTDKYSIEFLKSLNIENTFHNWKDFYHLCR